MKSRYTRRVRALVEHHRQLLLPGWRIALREELPGDFEPDREDDPAAVIGWDDHLFSCNLWLADSVLEGSHAYLVATIIHELMHPLFRELRGEFMPGKDDEEAHERWEHYEEMIVERVSLAFGDSDYPGTRYEYEL